MASVNIFLVFMFLLLGSAVPENLKGKGTDFCKQCAADISWCVVVGEVQTSMDQTEFECRCRPGYVGDGVKCDNVNECLFKKDNNCDNNALCTDNIGNFSCECNPGWTDAEYANLPGVDCIDVDECANTTGESPCGDTGACVNTPGSYSCDCAPGYYYPNDTTTGACTNIDECAEGTAHCDVNAVCKDTVGSYDCFCNDGYTGAGFQCREFNECLVNNATCGENTECTNTVGSYICSCMNGYQWNENKTDCIDINECENEALYNCGAHMNCSNTVGSYDCPCVEGFEKDANGGCVNIDECRMDNDICGDNAECTDTVGNYSCDCMSGYQWNQNRTDCVDLNECGNEALYNCGPNMNCINTVGSYDCVCVLGYERASNASCVMKKNFESVQAVRALIKEWQRQQLLNTQLRKRCDYLSQQNQTRRKRQVLEDLSVSHLLGYTATLDGYIAELKIENHLLSIACPDVSGVAGLHADSIFG